MKWNPCNSALIIAVVSLVVGVFAAPTQAAKLEAWKMDCFDINLNQADAISACSTSLRGRKINPRYLVQRGSLWLSLKDYQYAISDFTRTIDQDYGGIVPYYGRAAAYIGANQFIDAMLDIQTIMIRSMPDILLYKAINQLLSWQTGRQIEVAYVEEGKYPLMQKVRHRPITIIDSKIDLSEYFIGIPPFLILASFMLLALL